MKTAFIAISIFLAGFHANAESIISALTANLDQIHFDPASPLSRQNFEGGLVYVNFFTKEIHLTFQPAMNCPQGKFCALVVPAPLKVYVNLIKTEKDTCGNTIYKGKRDTLAVDGDLKEITVTDYTQNTCPTFVAWPETKITYRHEGYNRGQQYYEFHHHFTAGALRP
jgi:hypothetical protein